MALSHDAETFQIYLDYRALLNSSKEVTILFAFVVYLFYDVKIMARKLNIIQDEIVTIANLNLRN
jgi:hypothetical protein